MNKLAIFAIGAVAIATPAFAENWDFMLLNNTGKAIAKIEVAVAGSGNWVENIVDLELKQDMTIKAGGKTTIHFNKGATCKYDVRATFEDKSNAVWSGFNVCDNSYITVSLTNGQPSFKSM